MRIIAAIALFASSATAMATAAGDPLRAHTRAIEVTTVANACTLAQGSCNTVLVGELGIGDCTLSDGTYFDGIGLDGVAGQLVAITLRPLDATLTEAVLTLIPPPGDASKTPIVIGGSAQTIWYQLSSTGRWGIGIGTIDLFARGRYVVHIDCLVDDTPADPQSCVSQELLCGQTAGWNLTSQSCTFTSAPQRLYAPWYIYGAQGDTVDVTMESNDFAPLFGIYNDDGGPPLVSSRTVATGRAVARYTFPTDGWYYLSTTSVSDREAGFYTVSVECVRSGCVFPYITTPVGNRLVPYGSELTLTVTADYESSVTTTLVDADTGSIVSQAAGISVRTPPIKHTRRFRIEISNACGDARTEIFTVSPERQPRRRSVRK